MRRTGSMTLMRSSAVLAVFFGLLAVQPFLWAADNVQINTTGNIVEVTGGGPNAWTLRYANVGKAGSATEIDEARIAAAGPDRIYFSHGVWLRWIDSKRGVVIGRWRLPGRIVNIVPNGEQASIEIADKYGGRVFSRTFVFDPAHPEIPAGTIQTLLAFRTPQCEAFYAFITGAKGSCDVNATPPVVQLGRDQARALIPQIRQAIQHDPLSPWFSVLLGKVMLDAGDPSADAAFEQAINSRGDFTELLPISAFFENHGLAKLADEAFRRGYRDLLSRGNDPRLEASLLTRLVLYPIDLEKIDPSRRSTVIERIYQLTPNGEGAELAWTAFARVAKTPQEKELWTGRARQARKQGTDVFSNFAFQTDVMLLLIASVGFAKFWFTAVSYIRYRPQRFFDKEVAKKTHVAFWKRIPFLNIQYWSLAQRIGFVLIFLVGWFSAGWVKQSLRGVGLAGERPFEFESLAGPATEWFFQNRLSATPGRDLLVALSKQQSGDLDGAAQLYQRLPQFAESWNNLGVIRRAQGLEGEAHNEFTRALQMNPGLIEPAFNLGYPGSDYWTRIHQEYAPGSPMIAIPTRRIFLDAFAGGTTFWRLRSLWRDALRPWHLDVDAFKVVDEPGQRALIPALLWFALCWVVFLFVPPRLPVQRPAGKVGLVLAILFPGTSRKWGCAGGLILMGWMYFVIQRSLLHFGSPYILTFIGTVNLTRAYGAPNLPIGLLINPGWMWLYLPLLALFGFNLLVMLPEFRKLPPSGPTSATTDGGQTALNSNAG